MGETREPIQDEVHVASLGHTFLQCESKCAWDALPLSQKTDYQQSETACQHVYHAWYPWYVHFFLD